METEFVNRKTLHHLVVDKVYGFLIKESEHKAYIVNNNSKKFKLKLTTGEYIYPDIADFDNKLAYEIHIKGENRREYFNKLSEGWKGINVFIDEENSSETLVGRLGLFGFKAKRIRWKVQMKDIYTAAVKPIIAKVSEQVEKDENFKIDIKDIAKQIGLFDKDSDELVDGLMYVLFYNGYVIRNMDRNKIMIRKKKEGDILPDYLSEIMEQWEESNVPF
jgi:hypothetical protein